MKNSILLLIATVIMLGSMSSCIIVEDDYNPGPPPPPLPACEIYSTGKVCFENNTDRDMYVETDGFSFDVWSYSRTCAEIPAGFYDFYAIAGPFDWRGSFDVFICDQSNVFLDYRNQ